MGCKLHFYFEPNDYFTNSVLTKEYEMKCVPSDTNPTTFDGPEIVKCKGCKIDWKEGKKLPANKENKKELVKKNDESEDDKKDTSEDVEDESLATSFFDFFNQTKSNLVFYRRSTTR